MFTSKNDYNQNGGEKCRKWDETINIIMHDGSRDDMPPCEVSEAGELIYPPLPMASPPEFTQDRKFAVYMEFKQNIRSFTSGLKVKAGISALVLDGSKSPVERLGIIDQWQQGIKVDGLPARVLVFTSVLKAGVNLSAADRLILLVSCYLQCFRDTKCLIPCIELAMVPAGHRSNRRACSSPTTVQASHSLSLVHGQFCRFLYDVHSKEQGTAASHFHGPRQAQQYGYSCSCQAGAVCLTFVFL